MGWGLKQLKEFFQAEVKEAVISVRSYDCQNNFAQERERKSWRNQNMELALQPPRFLLRLVPAFCCLLFFSCALYEPRAGNRPLLSGEAGWRILRNDMDILDYTANSRSRESQTKTKAEAEALLKKRLRAGINKLLRQKYKNFNTSAGYKAKQAIWMPLTLVSDLITMPVKAAGNGIFWILRKPGFDFVWFPETRATLNDAYIGFYETFELIFTGHSVPIRLGPRQPIVNESWAQNDKAQKALEDLLRRTEQELFADSDVRLAA